MRFSAASLLLAALLLGCFPIFNNTKPTGEFLSEPLNLSDFNSEFDDYNSSLPMNRSGVSPLIFSSKRTRKDKFNLVSTTLYLSYDDKAKRLIASNNPYGSYQDDPGDSFWLNDLVNRTNENCNILGPNVLRMGNGDAATRGQYLILYAEDKDGQLDVSFRHNVGNVYEPKGPFKVTFLNSPADDAYPTLYEPSATGGNRELYFTSNRSGNFDLYRVKLPAGKTLPEILQTTEPLPVEKVEELSSTADDKCPFILGDRMIFTSNRPGGSGGFDLYESRYVNGTWTKPTNLGSRINTASDEYRPVVLDFTKFTFTYPLMVFSSNRPGGKGGFDLYLVGLEGSPN
jgi:hypothetical protein